MSDERIFVWEAENKSVKLEKASSGAYCWTLRKEGREFYGSGYIASSDEGAVDFIKKRYPEYISNL